VGEGVVVWGAHAARKINRVNIHFDFFIFCLLPPSHVQFLGEVIT